MSWLEKAPGARSPAEEFFGHRADLMEEFKAFYGTLWDEAVLDPALLEMIRLAVARVHRCDAELAIRHEASGLSDAKRAALANWRSSDLFSDSERVCLAYAERIPFEHTAITDAEAEAVKDALGEAGYVAFSVAGSLFDAMCRVRMVMALEPVQGDALHPPASAKGVLR
ncbi:carboxymuconolactone decarboxylase family protein [Erythrobacter rubeus]|uniref:Carboxymuconolactone decarboxylase family protein n=1 Tax=Erythrobacter rubeus TaxID=2760803 RepID=A0ABR8KTP1_9SPHN|nr:carboxymuconolactone decarboxylase family protein [Erythrobacter rubeus]MBD2843329.1 carboxymuconolactone decarboxylase family protein [Erythrobacter rubeus]